MRFSILEKIRQLRRAGVTVLVCLGMLPALRASATVITWTNTAGGLWTSPANWYPNSVPGSPEDVVFITNNGSYTVALDTSLTLASLTVGSSGGSGVQTLSWSSGTLAGCGLRVGSQGVLNLSGSADKFLVRRYD